MEGQKSTMNNTRQKKITGEKMYSIGIAHFQLNQEKCDHPATYRSSHFLSQYTW